MSVSEASEESPRLRAYRAAHGEFVKAFNEGDYQRAFSTVREDYEQSFVPGFTEKRLEGRRAVIEFFEEFRQDVGDWHMKPDEYTEAGPFTIVVGSEYSGFGQISGLASGLRIWDVIDQDEEGRVFRVRQFTDRDEALSAARDQPDSEQVRRVEGAH